jgi:hypothetical protein
MGEDRPPNAIGRAELLNWLDAHLDAWLEKQRRELHDSIMEHVHGSEERAEEIERLIRFVVWRTAYRIVGERVRLGPWLEPPFPEYDDPAEASHGA